MPPRVVKSDAAIIAALRRQLARAKATLELERMARQIDPAVRHRLPSGPARRPAEYRVWQDEVRRSSPGPHWPSSG